MGSPYTSPSASGYNANPPSDDGSETEANRGKWATVLAKIGNPLKIYADAINAAVVNAFARTPGGAGTATTGTSQTLSSDVQGKTVIATTPGITITSPDATSVEQPFGFHFVNASGGNVTFNPFDDQMLDGNGDSIVVPTGKGFWIETNGTGWNTGGQNFDVTPQLPRGYIGGLQLTQPELSGVPDDHDVTIAAGEARSAANTANLTLAAAITKRIDANWTSGDGNGGFPTALTLSNNTIHHVFLVDDADGNVDAGFDTSISAANLLSDTGGSEYRRIGSVYTDGSANIRPFIQSADRFYYRTAILDVDDASTPANSVTRTLSVPGGTGLSVVALMNVAVRRSNATQGAAVYIFHTDATDADASRTASPLSSVVGSGNSASDNSSIEGGQVQCLTNTSRQVQTNGDANIDVLRIATLGWIDPLGRYD